MTIRQNSAPHRDSTKPVRGASHTTGHFLISLLLLAIVLFVLTGVAVLMPGEF